MYIYEGVISDDDFYIDLGAAMPNTNRIQQHLKITFLNAPSHNHLYGGEQPQHLSRPPSSTQPPVASASPVHFPTYSFHGLSAWYLTSAYRQSITRGLSFTRHGLTPNAPKGRDPNGEPKLSQGDH